MTKALHAAFDKLASADGRVDAILQRDYPPGTRLRYEFPHGVIRSGVVVDIGHGHRVRVLSNTGKEYWIDARRIEDRRSR